VITCLALIKIAGRYVEMFGVAAFGALETVWSAFLQQVLPALFFRPEISLKFDKDLSINNIDKSFFVSTDSVVPFAVKIVS
jgi:hypothetical protein